MILKNRKKAVSYELLAMSAGQSTIGNLSTGSCGQSTISGIKLLAICLLLVATCNFATCKYGFKDTAPIPEEVKTFRVNYFENKADYKNPQLSP